MRTTSLPLAITLLLLTPGGSRAVDAAQISVADSVLSAELPDTISATVPVYLYGLRYAAPHDLVWHDHELFCHGVRIEPRERELSPPSAHSAADFALDQRAESAAVVTGSPWGSRTALQAMMSVYLADPSVLRAWLDDHDVLRVLFRTSRVPICIGSSGADQRSGDPIGDPCFAALDLARTLRQAWRDGRIVLLGSGYLQVVRNVARVRAQLEEAVAGRLEAEGPVEQAALRDVGAQRGRRP